MFLGHANLNTLDSRPARAGLPISIDVTSTPVQPDQVVRVRYEVHHTGGTAENGCVTARWLENRDGSSYWRAELGPFRRGDRVEYAFEGESSDGGALAPGGAFTVMPRLFLALLWHQHQPLYRDLCAASPRGSFVKPWVRLHAIRDYYAMAALLAEQPGVRATINLTPVLLDQIEHYANGGATDIAQELTLKPAESLSSSDREAILSSFFDADWHNQIFPHPRYAELFAKRAAREAFDASEIRDLQMWFNLAWFGDEFRKGSVELVTGEIASVRRFVEKQRDFSESDIEAVLAEQLKILRAVVPVHRTLQDKGVIEVSTTPFCHPILPLLIDTDRATIDRPGAGPPRRFAYPEDADAQTRLAVEQYQRLFARPPDGMWPAEGAVAAFAVPIFARNGVRWIASDQGVLARSGQWGYRVERPDVLCRAYRTGETGDDVSIFFRATAPSDAIGFHLQNASDPEVAVREFIEGLKARYGGGGDDDDRLLTIALDGENAWGAFRDDGRPFLRALYRQLAQDPDLETTTFSDYLEGRAQAGVVEARVYDLFTGSWIDEWGSAPGVDLGTWIGEPEENRAWELLGAVRDVLSQAPPASVGGQALGALYAAEGSDWFWWFGSDQDSGSDQEFDDLFRMHLSNALRLAGQKQLPELALHIVPHASVWTFAEQIENVAHSDRLVIRANCPGILEWWVNESHGAEPLLPVGGVLAGAHRYERTLGPFEPSTREVVFRFECRHAGCRGGAVCCWGRTYHVQVY
ncbi:MAG TPA: glycoside hydrolase family 57 protein [Polyangiaceae bacterium]|nr:glycoside hydrolase family 57 protein [Polyangiaceae bacterium]